MKYYMDWGYSHHTSLPKRRLFIEPPHDTRLNVPSPRRAEPQPDRSPMRSSSQARARRDVPIDQSYTSAYYDSSKRADKADSHYTNQLRPGLVDSENVRPNDSKFDETVLLKIQRQGPETLNLFLRRLGLEDYEPAFLENQVTSEDLPLLTRDDLADMGIPIGPRNRILSALQSETLETPLSSKREPSIYQSSPGSSTCSSKSAMRLQLHQEVQQFISGINTAEQRRKQQLKPQVTPEVKPVKPPRDTKSQSTNDSMAKMIEDLARRQELMMKAIEQNSQAMKMLAEARYQQRSPSPYVNRPRSVSMRRV